jgi:hypothetical protein
MSWQFAWTLEAPIPTPLPTELLVGGF